MVCINWGGYIYAVNSGHILEASLAYFMNPIITVLVGALVFKENLTLLQWLAILMAAAGVTIPFIGYGSFPAIALMIGSSFAVYGVLKKNVACDSQTSLFIETLVVAPVALIFIIYSEIAGRGSIGSLSGAEFLLLPLTGVITAVPLLLFAKGIKDTSYALAGIMMYANPTIQLLLGVALYHEKFTSTHTIMFGFIWAGLTLFLLSGFLQQRKRRAEKLAMAVFRQEQG